MLLGFVPQPNLRTTNFLNTMSKSAPFNPSAITIALILSLIITLTTYVLRGLGILGFIPGSVILLLITISIFLGIFYGISVTRRF